MNDIAICSSCNGRFPVAECPTESEGDWETGYYSVHVCPKCEDGGCVDDYDCSPTELQQAIEWGEGHRKHLLSYVEKCRKYDPSDASRSTEEAAHLRALVEAAKEYQAIEKLAKQGLLTNEKQISK